ncbi:hypothetical protein BCR36DRAFT_406550 [Piromyces finnis]|uniref:F-box domain-containing protein n=1 Tax=Piromyces finnis TaxID=1754191 RepID=A0A1Y1V002_9FUNG|nr:hypothetical protein BCR36DRAFT_406550 [Piromyces finnis]|eukprot:ORX44221.1 hypothetical protein BCR36DRAFT_406550 [Piromyces finnis]
MSSDIHIEKDNEDTNKKVNLYSSNFSGSQLEYGIQDGFSTPPPKSRKEDNKLKIEPKTPKKKSGKFFFPSIIEKKKSDLFGIYNNNIDDSSFPSSPTFNIQSVRLRKKDKKTNSITSYFNSTKSSFNSNSKSKSNFDNKFTNSKLKVNLKQKSSQDQINKNIKPPLLVKPNLSAFNKALKQTKLTFSTKQGREKSNDNSVNKIEENIEDDFSDSGTSNSFDSFSNSIDDSSFLFFNNTDHNVKNNNSQNDIFNNFHSELESFEGNTYSKSNNEDNEFTIKNNSQGKNLMKKFTEDKEKKLLDKRDIFDIFNDNSNSNLEFSDNLSDKYKNYEESLSPKFNLNIFNNKKIVENDDRSFYEVSARNIFEAELLLEGESIKESLQFDDNFYNFSLNKKMSKYTKQNINSFIDDDNNLYKYSKINNNISNTKNNSVKKEKRKITLPNDIWKNIINYLNFKEILSMSCTSKQMNKIIRELYIWKKIDIYSIFKNNNIKNKNKFLEELLKSVYTSKIEILIFNIDKDIPTPNMISLIIQNCKNLKSLILSDTSISLKHFENKFEKGERLKSLKYLNINNCYNINYSTLKHLVNGCPNLLKLECCNLNLKPGEFGVIQELQHLQYLNISGNKYLCNLDIKAIYNKENNIKYLDISNCNSLTDRAISFILKNAQNLETIKIYGSNMRITQNSFYLLTKLKIRNVEYQKRNK